MALPSSNLLPLFFDRMNPLRNAQSKRIVLGNAHSRKAGVSLTRGNLKVRVVDF